MSRPPATWLALALALAACGSPPVAAPKPVERSVSTAADIAGAWRASDELDSSYLLKIAADGTLDQTIDRGKLGTCTQRGRLAPAGRNELAVTYSHDECHRSVGGDLTEARVIVTSFTGDQLDLEVIAGRLDEHTSYRRAP
jgi:hypothetical protein